MVKCFRKNNWPNLSKLCFSTKISVKSWDLPILVCWPLFVRGSLKCLDGHTPTLCRVWSCRVDARHLNLAQAQTFAVQRPDTFLKSVYNSRYDFFGEGQNGSETSFIFIYSVSKATSVFSPCYVYFKMKGLTTELIYSWSKFFRQKVAKMGWGFLEALNAFIRIFIYCKLVWKHEVVVNGVK